MGHTCKIVVPGLILALAALLCIKCTSPTAGTATETENVVSMLYNPGGSPAVHAKVKFYPVNYNPQTGRLAKTQAATVDSTTTDAKGNYAANLDTGTYNVLASSDSGVVYQDSITVTKGSAIHPPADTLKAPGGLRGKVRLQPGDDARTVFILFFGTNTWGMPDDSTGTFGIANMAEGTYRVRFLTTLPAYVPKDTVLSVTAGKVDTLPHDIVLQYTGIPGPTGLTVSYDTLRQTVILAWAGADTSLIAGYNVYRAIKGQNFSLITQTPLPDTVTTYRDSTVTVGTTYQYEIVSRNAPGDESPKVATPGDTMKVVSSSLVTTTFIWNLNNTIGDTASINDTVKVCIAYSNPTRRIEKIVWYVDSLNSTAVKQKTDSLLAGKDTLSYSWKQPGNKRIFVKVTDGAGTVWTDNFDVTIVQDIPVPNAGADTMVSIKDTVRLHGTATQEFGIIVEWAWDIGNKGTFKATSKGDTNIIAPAVESLSYLCVLRVTDDDGNVAKDTVKITVLQDVPIIKFLSSDTIVDHGGTVRCSVYVQQQFGTMTVGIDTANSGNYKSLGNLGLSGGEAYSFSTGNACAWDSVKMQVTDDDGNVVAKGFSVRIRPRPLTISSIDSTLNTITVHYSQSQETDFAQYRIYRNMTNAVDTTSELWATITANGTVSFTTPTPSYTWVPRYYRIYQIDTEGLCSAGSNAVYGNVVNSPPPTPVVTYPANNGDSLWPNDKLCWNRSIDPNGNRVRYRVFVNYNNSGYLQFATALTDTFVQLTGCDSVSSINFRAIAYDTLGDSSALSAERTAFIKHEITDIDGNVYHTVTIGTQVWMVENLKTTRYNDGTAIPLITDDTAWTALRTPGYCWYNDSAIYGNTYGALYNWYSVNTGKLAPTDWHVPTESELSTLISYLGGDSVAGGKLKEAGTAHWNSPNTGATNETGFSALPGGFRWYIGGSFGAIGSGGYWWSSTAYDYDSPLPLSWGLALFCVSANVLNTNAYCIPMDYGYSVRCVRN